MTIHKISGKGYFTNFTNFYKKKMNCYCQLDETSKK